MYLITHFLLPENQSLALKVGFQVTLVSGKISSWKTAVLTLGTVNDNGSIVVFVNR